MQKRKVVLGFLVPTNENAPKAIHPTVSTFHHPAPRFFLSSPLELLGLFAARTNMRCEPKFCQEVVHFLKVVALVQTHALWLCLRGHWPIWHNVFDGFARQFHIVAIGSCDGQTNRHTVSLGQQATFDATFAAIGGVRPAFFPHPAALWSWHHPCSASPNPALSIHQSVRRRVPRISKRRLPLPIPEIAHGPSNPNTGRFHPGLSIDSRCVGHRKCHPRIFGPAPVDVRRQSDGYSGGQAVTVETLPRVHRSCESSLWFCYSACGHACVSV